MIRNDSEGGRFGGGSVGVKEGSEQKKEDSKLEHFVKQPLFRIFVEWEFLGFTTALVTNVDDFGPINRHNWPWRYR